MAKNKSSSRLRRYAVTIQQLVGSQDSTGAQIKSWTTFATAMASIEATTGYERVASNQLVAGSNIKMCFWFIDGIKPAMRVVYGTRIFDIIEVADQEGTRREIQLTCVERTEAGN